MLLAVLYFFVKFQLEGEEEDVGVDEAYMLEALLDFYG